MTVSGILVFFVNSEEKCLMSLSSIVSPPVEGVVEDARI